MKEKIQSLAKAYFDEAIAIRRHLHEKASISLRNELGRQYDHAS